MIEPNDMSEYIKVKFDSKGVVEGYIIPCSFFKTRGKWYMDEDVIIPLDTPTYDIHNTIEKHRRVHEFITVGKGLTGVPFLVPAGE